MKEPCVYILASEKYGTLYIGVTSDLIKRVWEHKNDVVAGFTKRYGAHTLVWFEQHETMESAISREGAESVEARLEIEFDRSDECGLARLVL
jgi:putative endonuclease